MFNEIIQKLDTFNANAWGYVADAIREHSDDITYINQSRIIDKGLDAEGKKLKNSFTGSSSYSEPYLKLKKSKGVYNGHINLYLSGEYLGSYKTEVKGEEVTIDVDASNADLDAVLEAMFGADIKGLTEKEWESVVVKFIIPRILAELTKVFK